MAITTLALLNVMDNSENMSPQRSKFSKRSTRATLFCLVTMTLAVAVYNSSSEESVNKVVSLDVAAEPTLETAPIVNTVVLEDEVINKDPNVVYHREEVLNDYENRISDEFSIPEGLRDRVGFWFDIYSRYDSNQRVIHHVQFPWIVFKVVDVTPIINADKPKARWMRNMKADDSVTAEADHIKAAIKSLAAGKALNENNEYQVMVAKALEPLKGSLKAKAKQALGNVRVQTGQKDFFGKGLEVSPRYLAGMEEIFRNHKLPTELTRLPFVESSFNKKAVSKVGASGIWQFMDYTGKSFMTVNEHIDERNSPFKATVAAARLLKENHMILRRSWPLAITAWNHGPGGMRKAMKETGTQDLSKIVGNYQSKHFDFASSNFYCEFLAALYTEKYHDQIFEGLDYEKTLDLHAVKLARKTPAKEVFRLSGLAKEDFLSFNPDLKKALEKNAAIPSGFTVMVDTPARLGMNGLLTKDTRASAPAKVKVSQSDVSFNNESTRN